MTAAVDWGAALAELLAERAQLDVTIDAVRRRVNGGAEPAPKIPAFTRTPGPPVKRGKKGRGKGGRPSTITDAQLSAMRKLYEEGVSVSEITKRLKTTASVIYGRASAGKWKRPGGQGVKGSAKTEPPPKGEQLAGSVKCTNPDCGVMTEYDPCRRCGTKLKRKWG